MLTIWYTCFGLLALLWIVVGYLYGPRAAVGTTMIASFLVPRWIKLDVIGTELDVSVGAGIVALGLYCLHRGSQFATKLVAVDFAMIAFIACHIATDIKNDGMGIMPVLNAYGEWFVPYVLGRLAIHQWQEIRWIARPIAIVATVLSIAGILETLFRTNLYEFLLLERVSEIEKYMDRFGFRRAFGPTENPIYFGCLLLILFPWTIEYTRSSLVDHGKWLPVSSPISSILGVLSTVSRAPILGFVFLSVAPILAFASTRLRIAVVTCCVTLAGLIFLFGEDAIESLHALGEDAAYHQRQKIVIAGERVDYSSTNHRLQLFRIYGTALRQVGFLGYGSERTSVFPPRVPFSGNNDVEAIKNLWSVDNQYILTCLRFGYIGLFCWCSILVAATFTAWRLAERFEQGEALFYWLMMMMFVAMILILFTVWMPHDYGFLLVWSCGAIAGRWAGFKTTRS